MESKQYLNFAKDHPILKNLVLDEQGRYEPFYRLGERLRRKVRDELVKNGEKADKVGDYIPFGDNTSMKVESDHIKNLQKLLREKLSSWPYEEDNTKLRSFWYCYAKFKGEKIYTSSNSFVMIDILNFLCQYVGFKDFDEFVHVEFSCPDELVLILVNNTTIKDDQIEGNLKSLFLNIIDDESLPISGNINGPNGQIIPSAGTFSEAKEIATKANADLLFFVSGYLGGFILLKCHSFNKVWAQHHGSWEKKIRIDEIIDEETIDDELSVLQKN